MNPSSLSIEAARTHRHDLILAAERARLRLAWRRRRDAR